MQGRVHVIHHWLSQDFGLGGGAHGHASVIHTCEAAADSLGHGSAPAFGRVIGGAPERNKNSKKDRLNYMLVEFLQMLSASSTLGMIYIHVGEMCVHE